MKSEIAEKILKETKSNFDKIAEEFSKTRESPWEIMESFLLYIKEGDKILDIGCGNGRLYELVKEKSVDYVGIDNSEKMIEIAKKKFPEARFLIADALNLPFKNEEFDAAFMIAVFPHIPSEKLQIQALSEVNRVLKKNGYLFITCWNLFQPKYFLINLKNRFKNPKIYQGVGLRDFFIPWKSSKGEILAQRFHHLFTKKELKKILKKSGFKIEKIFYEFKGRKSSWLKGSNLVAITKK